MFYGRSGDEGAKRYYKKFRERYKEITAGQQVWLNEALVTKQFKTVTGLVFYWPNAKIKGKSGWIEGSNDICNYPIQNFAGAEIVPVGTLYLWHLLRVAGLNSIICNTIHDSALLDSPQTEVEQVLSLAKYGMEDCVIQYLDKVYGICFNIPLEIESKVSTHWSDTEEWQEKYIH